jgi:LysM repeat protein
MQYDNSDDPFGFWKDEPTRQLKRTQARTRAHADTSADTRPLTRPATRMVPVVRTDRTHAEPGLHPPRNPLVTRIALMAGVTVLLVPFALSLRDDRSPVRASNLQGVDTVQVGRMPAPAPTVAAETDAPTTLAPTPVPSPPSTEAVTLAATAAPTDPPTTAAPVTKKPVVAKTTTTVAAAAKPAAATQSADKACASTYTVVSGDGWSTIASRAQITMKALLAANNATVKTVLLVGKSICLPAGAATPAPPTTRPPSTTQPRPPTTQPATPPVTTPPVTTPPATTQPPPPANTYSRAQVAQIIRDVWPDDLEDEAIRIATRESNLIPTVRNYCCYGLFQIYYTAHRTWLATMGITSAAQLYDPQVNATAAYALYRNSGWAPWAISTPTTTVA